jgi:hypothetical protein
MAAIVQAYDRTFAIRVAINIPKTLVIFCGAGVAVFLLVASYGLDLSPGFF